MILLGIETSCDETGIAIVEGTTKDHPLILRGNTLASSLSEHAKTGGIIPEIAARHQLEYIIPTLDETLQIAHLDKSAIDAIAVTVGPGLIGSLLVGVETAKTLAYIWDKPLIPVNHLYGHIYANWITTNSESRIQSSELSKDQKLNAERLTLNTPIAFPLLALIVSGGHTDLVLLKKHGDLKWLGGTRDDAAGEAFDKIGRLLGFPYPAGSTIATLAKNGNPNAFPLPRPMIGSGDMDFSFSGLKTAVLNLVKKNGWSFTDNMTYSSSEASTESRSLNQNSSRHVVDPVRARTIIPDLCASFQQAIVDVLVKKTLRAAQQHNVKSILLGGGVAANEKLRNDLALEIRNLKLEIDLHVPSPKLCTDNGAMIAAAAFYNDKKVPWQEVDANPELYFD